MRGWAEAFQFYARLKRELRAAVLRAPASPECKEVIWRAIAEVFEEKAAELEELAASARS